jgi:MFS family permease
MIYTIKSFFAPLLAVTILTMGAGLLNSLLSINMSLSGYSEQIIGLVMSCNYLGVTLGIFFCQPIVQRVGHIRAFAVFAAMITAISLMHGIYMTPWFWAFLRLCNGLCLTGLFMVIESWLNEKVEPMMRGRLLSVYMILVYFGSGSGQLLLNVGNVQSKNIFMIAGILFAMCLIPISITRAVHPQPLEVPRYNLLKLFRLAPFSMVGSFTAGLINSAFYSIGPMFALKIGLPIAQVSWFMSLTVWSGLLFQWPVGLLSDRLDRLTVLWILGFGVLLVSVAISILGALSLSLLLLLTACFGVVFTIYPVAMARAQDNIDKKDIVPVSGALLLFFGVGACLGPVLSSSMIAITGPWGLYHFTAICGGVLGGTAWICRKKFPGKAEDRVPFIPIPKTSPVVSALDPRGDTDARSEAGGVRTRQ